LSRAGALVRCMGLSLTVDWQPVSGKEC